MLIVNFRQWMLKRVNISKTLIVIGGFLCYMLADGCTFSIGILYSEFLDVFHQSKASTALLPALIYALPQFSGPIICPFVDATSSYFSAIIGGLILAVSIFISRFVISLKIMYVTMGFFASIGLELTYVSAIIAVTKGFSDQKYLGLALGITVSGSGIGVFTFNPLLNYLINEYTWQGALTIEAAIFLHIILAGVIFKLASSFLAFSVSEQVKESFEENAVSIEIISAQPVNNLRSNSPVSISYSATIITNTTDIENKGVQSKPNVLNSDQRCSVYLSMTQTKYCEPFYNPINRLIKSASLDRRINTGDNFPVNLPVDERSASFVRRLSTYSTQNMKGSRQASQETLSSKPSLLFENSETDNILENSLSKDKNYNPITDQQSDHFGKASKWEIFKKNLKKSILSLFSVTVWKNKQLLLFYVISFLFGSSVVVLWTFSYNFSTTIGIDDTKASLLVSLIGGGSCIGQITFGLLSEYIPAILLYAVGCLFAGIITFFIHWISAYWALSIFHFVFGFCQGVSYALFSLILLDYTSVELYSASLGIFLLLSGFGNLIGTLLSGFIFDINKNYDTVFMISGITLIFCSIAAIPLIYLKTKKLHTKSVMQ